MSQESAPRGRARARTASAPANGKPPLRAPRLDEIDLRILDALQKDSKITNAELSRRIGISPPSTLERVRKLEAHDVIKGYVAILCPEQVNKKTTVLVTIMLREHGREILQQIRRDLVKLDEVQACWHTAGEEDFVLKVVVTDMTQYEHFVTHRLSAIPGVGRIRSTFVLNAWKDQTQIPLDGVVGE